MKFSNWNLINVCNAIGFLFFLPIPTDRFSDHWSQNVFWFSHSANSIFVSRWFVSIRHEIESICRQQWLLRHYETLFFFCSSQTQWVRCFHLRCFFVTLVLFFDEWQYSSLPFNLFKDNWDWNVPTESQAQQCFLRSTKGAMWCLWKHLNGDESTVRWISTEERKTIQT